MWICQSRMASTASMPPITARRTDRTRSKRSLAGFLARPDERPVEGAESVIQWERNETIIACSQEGHPQHLEQRRLQQPDEVGGADPHDDPEPGQRGRAEEGEPHVFHVNDP